jgi:hypothetical protein
MFSQPLRHEQGRQRAVVAPPAYNVNAAQTLPGEMQ